jgi:hypothetical protein
MALLIRSHRRDEWQHSIPLHSFNCERRMTFSVKMGCRPSMRCAVRRGRRPKTSREGTRGVEVADLIYGDLTFSGEPLRPR